MRFKQPKGKMRRAGAARLATAVCMLGGAFAPAHAEVDTRAATSALGVAADRQLAEFASRADQPGTSVDTRDLVAAAWLTLQRNGDVKTAQSYALRAFAGQDTNRGSKNFGWVPWRSTDRSIGDPNAIEFATISLAPILQDYAGKFQPDAQQTLRARAMAALAALSAHQVKSTYTNIALMNAASLMLLGEELGVPQAVAEGMQRFEAWRSLTGTTGLREFGSPIYYATDIATLTTLAHYVRDEKIRHEAEEALNFLWADTAAHYFTPAARLAGAHSRVGHYFDSRGPIDEWAALAGLAPLSDLDRSITFDQLMPFLVASTGPYRWRFPGRLTGYAYEAPRDVVARWRDGNWGFRWTWISHNVSIGCANGYAGPQNELFNGIFSDDQSIRQVGVTASADDPYSAEREADPYGHMKAVQKRFDVACVGSKGMALVVFDGTAGLQGDDHFQIVLPTAERLLVDGRDVQPEAGMDQAVREGGSIVVATKTGAIAIRVVPLPGAAARAVAPRLQVDAASERLKLARLDLLPANSSNAPARVALLVSATDTESPEELAKRLQNVDVRANIHKDIMEVDAAANGTGLGLGLEASAHFAPRLLSVDGAPFGVDLLSINGREVGRPLWGGGAR